ncbi:MAG: LPS assembly protein LptD [Pseudomonadales bacterium]|nr:LPS assembly protein LptD [Pseudomonadales bacterium]MDP6470777.1 LPS assembly protein LptD [Pseudomonadales bacterium]MDP6828271.1 LPS assembly protein LptD [Pseudomonadales bacterium]MDP6973015.1 LPS assembly protein LptD [Pseudomonadales bacterium]
MGALRTLLVAAWWLLALWAHSATPEDQPILYETHGGFVCGRAEETGKWRCEGASNAARASASKERRREAADSATPLVSPKPEKPAPRVTPPPDAEPPSAIERAPASPPVAAQPTAKAELPQRPHTPFQMLEDFAASLWVPESRLSEKRQAGYCAGGYLEPAYPGRGGAEIETLPITVEADGIGYDVGEEIQLEGDVTLSQGDRTVRTRRARVDEVSWIAHLEGGVRIEEPGLIAQGESAQVDLRTRAADVSEAQFVLVEGEFRGDAQTIKRDTDGNLDMQRASFTRCQPDSDGWVLSARDLHLPEDEVFGTARNATIRVHSVPVFYTPYLLFPVSDERVSGFLFPDFGYSSEDGFDLALPYYLNLAPSYDATLTPRWMSERGVGLEAEFRHRSSWAETSLGGAFLTEDDLYNGTQSLDDWEDDLALGMASPSEFDPADRWLYSMDHRGQLGRFRTRIDYTAVSDRDYFRDLGTDLGVSSRIQLQRLGEVRYDRGGFAMRLWAQRFQRLDEIEREEYERLPELDASYVFDLGPFDVSIAGALASFDRDNEDQLGINALEGERMHVEPRITLPFSWPFGFLTISGGYRYTRYDLESEASPLDDDQPERSIGMGSVGGGLFFERDVEWFGTPLVHTLEPRAYYLYQEYEDQTDLPLFDAKELTFNYIQLYRDNRFTGIDRIGDANQLSAGVTTRFLSRVDGREYFRASIGGIVYFEDREVTLRGTPTEEEFHSTSALAAEVLTHIGNWRFGGNIVWDPHDNEVDESGVLVGFQPDSRRMLNVGYRKRVKSDIEQTDLSVYWPISERFSVFGRWNYDLVSARTIEVFGGIEYNDCCWQIRLISRRFLDAPSNDFTNVEPDDGIFLQIGFRGLGGFGNRIESVLQRGIRGYRTENFIAY